MNNIIKQIEDFTIDFIGTDFKFRQHQKETIVSIIDNIVNNKESHNHIIEAPTGSGKSLIAIIAAGVLNKYYGLNSYILCSDLFLWQQYSDFIDKHPMLSSLYGYVKGQRGNYECLINKEDMSNAYCKMCGMSWSTLFNTQKAASEGFKCAKECEYINQRRRAVKSPITVITYQLFLQMIGCNSNSSESDQHNTFTNRQVIFCDECHNIPDIVQNMITTTVKISDFDNFITLYNYAVNENASLFDAHEFEVLATYKNQEALIKDFDNIFDKFSDTKSNTAADKQALDDYYIKLSKFIEIIDFIKDNIKKKKTDNIAFTKEDIIVHKAAVSAESYIQKFNDYITAISEAGNEYIVKQINELRTSTGIPYTSVSFNCTKEDWMINKYLLSQADWKVLFSATVGGQSAYEENIGIKYTDDKNSKYEVVPSTFKFDKSPIIFLNRYKMSFKEKEQSLESLKPIIFKTIEKFNDKHGIIQTGSYDIAKQLVFYAPYEIRNRLILYNGAKEKSDAITKFRYTPGAILVGPTLCEGIDLPDDLCRFIIILKMPYPQMKDALVSAKMKLFPLWYNSKTSTSIIQGIGRGIRNEDDWCITYIYDACFYNLYINTKEQYPQELQDRIKIYN